METYIEIKKRHRTELEALPIQWAFNKQQFKEGMENLELTIEDVDKTCTVPGGGFMRKTDAKSLGNMLLRHSKEMEQAIAQDTEGISFILDMFEYELANHEYNITYSVEPTLDALGITAEDLAKNPALLYGLNKASENQR